jgi:hypothetical protein
VKAAPFFGTSGQEINAAKAVTRGANIGQDTRQRAHHQGQSGDGKIHDQGRRGRNVVDEGATAQEDRRQGGHLGDGCEETGEEGCFHGKSRGSEAGPKGSTGKSGFGFTRQACRCQGSRKAESRAGQARGRKPVNLRSLGKDRGGCAGTVLRPPGEGG